MQQINTLIIDDDEKICDLLSKNLINNNINSIYCTSTLQAKNILQYFAFSIILLDYLLPKENGLEFIAWLNHNLYTTPIIMLTAINNTDTKISALKNGAFDYLTKPFNMQELILKINKIVNHSTSADNKKTLSYQGLTLINNVLSFNFNSVILSYTENKILTKLMLKAEILISKEEIIDTTESITDTNLSVIIMRIRNKIFQLNPQLDYIKTIRGKGFILTK